MLLRCYVALLLDIFNDFEENVAVLLDIFEDFEKNVAVLLCCWAFLMILKKMLLRCYVAGHF